MSLDHNSDFFHKIKGQPSDGDVHERKLWNDRFILESVEKCARVILAWGNHGTWQQQDLDDNKLKKKIG